jgi:hypothetical protein
MLEAQLRLKGDCEQLFTTPTGRMMSGLILGVLKPWGRTAPR